jgi:hypothetical protein
VAFPASDISMLLPESQGGTGYKDNRAEKAIEAPQGRGSQSNRRRNVEGTSRLLAGVGPSEIMGLESLIRAGPTS